jgi:peptidoglycan/LPS O-acetylase OafA/YrhL
MENLRWHAGIVLPNYIPQFDGLRGIAILAVFVAYSEFLLDPSRACISQYGRFDVDLFFVLPGFLITIIRIDSKGSSNYIRNFCMRRALRIWLRYFLILAIAFIGLPLVFAGIREAASRQ